MRWIKTLSFLSIPIVLLIGLAAGLNVDIISNPSEITVGEESIITVTTLNDTFVNFTATPFGNLNSTSAITDSSGVAMITVNSTIAGIATINASVGSDYNTTNVTFIAGKPDHIDVNVSQYLLVVGNTTTLNLTAHDIYNNTNSTVNFILNIELFDTFGTKINETNITQAPPYNMTHLDCSLTSISQINSTNASSSMLLEVNSTLSGNVTITAIVDNITSIFNITFIPAEVSDFVVYCEGDTCNRIVNQTVNISVQAIDIYGNPVNGTTLSFNATPPDATEYNSPIWYNSLDFTPNTSTTHLDGSTDIVIFRTDKRSGDNLFYISTGSVNKSYIISGIADVPVDLFLSHSPDYDVPANSYDLYLLKAQVTDQFHNPVQQAGPPYTKKVHFYPSSIETYVLLNEKGAATIEVGPTPYLETINTSAFYVENGYTDTSIWNSTNLSFVSGNLSRFIFYANPDSVMYQNGKKDNHNATIFLKALDEWGHPVRGVNVTLTNTNFTLGNLTADGVDGINVIHKVTDSSGGILALFSSNVSAGNDTIMAENGSINASLNISIKDKTFISVNITFEPNNITTGQPVNVTTIITVEGETPVSRLSANAMLVLDNSGSMDPDYYAGTALDILLLIDTSGSMDDHINSTSSIHKITAAKNAAKLFNANMISNDRVGLYSFDDSVVKESNLNNNITYINNKITSLSPGGYTSTAKAVKDATTYLKTNTRPGARPIIILLSDGLPTKSLSGSTCNSNYEWCPTFDAITQANITKNTMINGQKITLYAIGFGTDADNETMAALASPGSYYYAATAEELEDIYYNIAQQISDFDITSRKYGMDGFTPYLNLTGSVNSSAYKSYNISLDDDVTDFKVEVDNPYVIFNLTSPDTILYPRNGESGFVNRSGFYNVSNDKSKGQFIWIEPENNTYDPSTDKNRIIPEGTWILNVTTNNATNITFNVTTYIDKISAVKAGSLAFISSFDATRGDRAGLVRYSNLSKPISSNQTSYVMNGSTWVGYFDSNNIDTSDWNVKFPSSGNYPGNNKSNWTNRTPGVDQIRVHFVKIDVEANHDFVNISDKNNNRVASYTNLGSTYSGTDINKRRGANISNVWSPWVNGDTININFSSDASYNYSGFQIDKIETMINCTFYLSWPNNTDTLDMNLYQGTTLVKNATRSGNSSTLNAAIYSDKSYYIEVKGTNITNETNFTINTTKNMNWFSYTANVGAPIEDSNTSKTFVGLNNAINNMTADGLTAIDEGLYLANNQFPINSIRPTIVIMTDGLDNAGYRSLLEEAYRARNNNTIINTIGFGNNESEVDNVTLERIANITGGEYKFAPNTSELKSIFQGFASNLVKFTATDTTLNLRIPNNYISDLSVARLTYQNGTGNSTNTTNKSINFTIPTAPGTGHDDPFIEPIGNTTLLSWSLPNLTVGDKWGIWYQLLVEGSGYIPLILEGSNITYFSLDSNQTIVINIINITNAAGSDIGGIGAGVSYIALGNLELIATPSEVFMNEPSRLTISSKYTDGNPAIARVNLYSNLGYFNISDNPLDNLMISGSDVVNFTSHIAGKARINAWGRNGNNSVYNNVTVFVRPRGKITVS